jgi:DNA polymerase
MTAHAQLPLETGEAAVPVIPLATLREEAKSCRRCPLYLNATQTVFGEGPAGARLVLVGEQPGDQEDLAGRPFVGPAGRILDQALAEAGIERKAAYLTNAVKHFKNEPRGKRRLHKRPNAGEVQACRWWMDRELATIRPRVVVALGATAAQALARRPVSVLKERGHTTFGVFTGFITIHPSFLLRIRDASDKRAEYARFIADLKAAQALSAHKAAA